MVRISPQEKKAILAFLAGKEERRRRRLHERFARATLDAERIVRMIGDRFAPLRIHQWGPLLDRRRFQEISDMDVAAEGLDGPERIFEIYVEAERLTALPLGIVEIEKIHPLHATSIREQGKVVHGRPD